jgi:hypothetical protein
MRIPVRRPGRRRLPAAPGLVAALLAQLLLTAAVHAAAPPAPEAIDGSFRYLPAAASFTSARMSGTERGVAGKGAWFMIFGSDWTERDPQRARALVQSAVAADLSHLYVRVADSKAHFYASTALRDLLPAAHEAGLNVLGWIEPLLENPERDAADAVAAALFSTQGERLDGLALTVEETPYETEPYMERYLRGIRLGNDLQPGLGDGYLLVGSTYPLPSLHSKYGYASLSRWCQVFAPMTYWRATGLAKFSDDGGTRAYIGQVFREFKNPAINPFNRPLSITAQAYDAAEEHGTPGAPPAAEILASLEETVAQGGMSWSFYRLADADNGVTSEETAAVASYGAWRRT